MIDVGAIGPLAHSGDKTGLELGTFLADAGLGFRVYPAPERDVFGQVDQLAAVAHRRFLRPVPHFLEMVHLIQAFEDRLVFGLCDAVETGVIRAPFHIFGA